MRRILPILGWLLAAIYFGVLFAFNVGLVGELLGLPSGFDPGWWPLIEADALYGGAGLLIVLLARLTKRRWLSSCELARSLAS